MKKSLIRIIKNELGFTLIEVMVVIIMVGILAAIAVPIYSNYVYRARAAEAITTLGAVKTFLLERQNATGSWPEQGAIGGTETGTLYDEFSDFKELYYFTALILTPADGFTVASTPQVQVTMNTNEDTFGTQSSLTLTINITDETKNGWSGEIRDKYAKHLPAPTS
jgi:prepilin-type N-terminal cleavage/methylation domain-containing protein